MSEIDDLRTQLWLVSLKLALINEWSKRNERLARESVRVKQDGSRLEITWQWEPPPFDADTRREEG